MITLEQYVGQYLGAEDWTEARQANARRLLLACAALQTEMLADGIKFPDNPATHSGVSGQTLGGFRPQACTIGAATSAHKEGRAVDRYDPAGLIDAWCIAHQTRLKAHGIFIEHPSKTEGWSHWTDRAPGSGHQVFFP